MRSVKALKGVAGGGGIADRWYVSIGQGAVGPVNLELLVRGVEAGKVPLDSYVRNEAWTVWRPLSDVLMVSAGAPAEAAPRSGAALTLGALAGTDSQPTLRQLPRWDAPAAPEPPPSRDSRPTLPRITRLVTHQNA